MLEYPSLTYQGPDCRLLGNPWLSPTDCLLATLTHRGMKKRLGIASTPSIALQHRHIEWNLRHRQTLFLGSTDPYLRYLLSAANLVELLGWGGWLRASEVFSLNHGDVSCCLPTDGDRFGLPAGIGAVFLRLLAMTKSSPYMTADVVLASTFASGLSPLSAWLQFMACCQDLGWTTGPLFRLSDGTRWSSHYFRIFHLYPLLRLQRALGDPALTPFDDSPGNSIEHKFYSFHTYRRGGRSQASRKRDNNLRKATNAETIEHGRWRSRGGPTSDMPTHYREWTVEDKIYITLCCM